MDRLAHSTKITRCIDATAAGTGDTITGTAIDMSGFNGACFIVAFGAITASAVTTVKLQQSDDSGGSPDDFSDIVGTAVSVADDDDTSMAYIDLIRPTKRYVRVAVVRATANSVIDGAVCLQYGAHATPVTHDATTVLGGETHDDAAEGTA